MTPLTPAELQAVRQAPARVAVKRAKIAAKEARKVEKRRERFEKLEKV